MENKVFALDGRWYDVYVPSSGIKRSVALLDGQAAGRAKAGNMVLDTIGTYYNYSITIMRNSVRLDEYDLLHKALRSAGNREHDLTIPFAQSFITYRIYVANIDDELELMHDGKNYWNGMTVKFTPIEPNEIP